MTSTCPFQIPEFCENQLLTCSWGTLPTLSWADTSYTESDHHSWYLQGEAKGRGKAEVKRKKNNLKTQYKNVGSSRIFQQTPCSQVLQLTTREEQTDVTLMNSWGIRGTWWFNYSTHLGSQGENLRLAYAGLPLWAKLLVYWTFLFLPRHPSF